MDAIAQLSVMRSILSQPGAWTQRAMARKADGTSTEADDPAATCFCLMGAMSRARLTVGETPEAWAVAEPAYRALLRAIEIRTDGRSRWVYEFNDYVAADPASVLDVIDTAMEVIRKEPAACLQRPS